MPCEGWWESWLEGGVGTTWSRRAAGGALGGLRGRVADRGLCSEGLPARDAELGWVGTGEYGKDRAGWEVSSGKAQPRKQEMHHQAFQQREFSVWDWPAGQDGNSEDAEPAGRGGAAGNLKRRAPRSRTQTSEEAPQLGRCLRDPVPSVQGCPMPQVTRARCPPARSSALS